ncbi:MAG: hypothetical protein KDC39_11935 [Actinobacteria bacterium]|nr:hypothetical protein [Actinomycetota bacterium]
MNDMPPSHSLTEGMNTEWPDGDSYTQYNTTQYWGGSDGGAGAPAAIPIRVANVGTIGVITDWEGFSHLHGEWISLSTAELILKKLGVQDEEFCDTRHFAIPAYSTSRFTGDQRLQGLPAELGRATLAGRFVEAAIANFLEYVGYALLQPGTARLTPQVTARAFEEYWAAITTPDPTKS